MSKPKDEVCVVDLHNMWIHAFTTVEEAPTVIAAAKEKAEKDAAFWAELAKIHNSEYHAETAEKYRNAHYQAMTYEQFRVLEREKLLGKPLQEISEDQFYEMLNVLPPIGWTSHKGVEVFCMSEFYTGFYTNQYAHDKATGKYYTKLVDYADRSTWIPEILYPDTTN